MKQTRGVRNNNPGNIDRTATPWQGAAADQSGDERFVVFKTPEYGIRALVKTLLTYQNVHGIKTLQGIINRWAPPVENNTKAYIAAVARACGVKPTEPIQIDSCEVMFPLVNAIIAHENAGYRYPDKTVLEGMRRAGVHDVKPKGLFAGGEMKALAGVAVTSVAGAGSSVAEHAPTIKGWANQLSDFAGSPLIQWIATGLITLAGVLALIGIISKAINRSKL